MCSHGHNRHDHIIGHISANLSSQDPRPHPAPHLLQKKIRIAVHFIWVLLQGDPLIHGWIDQLTYNWLVVYLPLWKNIVIFHRYVSLPEGIAIHNWLGVEPFPSEKWWTSSVGMMKFPMESHFIAMLQTTNQIMMCVQWKRPMVLSLPIGLRGSIWINPYLRWIMEHNTSGAQIIPRYQISHRYP